MNDDLLRILLDDDPENRDRRLELSQAISPDAADWAARWIAFERALGDRVSEFVPETDLLVSLALERSGHAELLSDDDRRRLFDARPRIEEALQAVPSIETVLSSMGRDVGSFLATWNSAFEAERLPAPSRMRRILGPDLRSVRSATPLRRYGVRILAAAVVVLFAVVTTLVARRDAGLVTVAAESEPRVVSLAEGSTVRLQPGSELTYSPEGGAGDRVVQLAGRAYFDITHDGSLFTVETQTARTMVLGTSFAVSATNDETEIVLVTGRVAVSAVGRPDAVVVLAPGEHTFVTRENETVRPTPVDVTESLRWTGVLIFRATTMRQVARRLNETYGVPVRIDRTLENEEITGTFMPERPLSEVVSILAETLGGQVIRSDSGELLIAPR